MSIKYKNDRRLVEEIVIQLVFVHVASSHIGNHDEAKSSPIIDMFIKAGQEIMPRMTVSKSRKMFDRILPVKQLFVREGGKTIEHEKLGIAAVMFINNMIECGGYFIEEGSTLDLAIMKVIEIIEPKFQIPEVRRSAFKAARRALGRMHEAGYFRDVDWRITL